MRATHAAGRTRGSWLVPAMGKWNVQNTRSGLCRAIVASALRSTGFALLVPLLLALVAAADAGAGEHKFAGLLKCKRCHEVSAIGDQYGSWLQTKHAETFGTLATDQAKKWASEADVADPQTDERCIKCHTTAYGIPDERVSRKFDREAGVQCEACHGAGADFRKKKIMIDRELAISKGLIPQTEEVCLRCHNDESPAWDPERYSLENGKKVGFNYDQAVRAIAHPVPEGYDPLAEDEAD